MKELKLCKECNHEKLIDFGFRKYGTMYRLTVPIYSYHDMAVISVSFGVSALDNHIGYDVIDNNTGMIYSPYYNNSYSSSGNLVLKKVNRNVNKVIRALEENQICTVIKTRKGKK